MEKVSVIIPTYGRAQLAKQLKASIIAMHPQVEVVIIDGYDNTSKAKNIGWRQSHGDVCIFFDDDIEITSKTISSHIAQYIDQTIAGVAGRVINDHEEIHGTTSVITGGTNTLLQGFSFNFWSEKRQYVRYPYGCNQSYRRNALQRSGGFDESFPKLFEEIDLGLRMVQKYGKIIFEPQALVYHHKAPNGGNREKNEIIQQHLYRAYGRMIAKHVPLIVQPLSFVLRARHAVINHAFRAFLSGYVNYYRS